MSEIVSWVAHGFRQRGIKLSSRTVNLLLALALFIALLALARLLLVGQVVASARDLQSMREDLCRLQRENASIELEIARIRSVETMWNRSEALDLAPAAHVEFVRP